MTPLVIPCEGAALAAMLHPADGQTGIVIVAGGVQTRVGAHRSSLHLAEALADAGFPVLRFDRRGTGDSDGDDPGFEGSGPDLAAAANALRASAPVTCVIGFGLCDGASALALHGRARGYDAVILANPWTRDDASDPLPPAAAVAARYRQRLLSPHAWSRLLRSPDTRGAVARGLKQIVRPAQVPGLVTAMRAGLGDLPAHILLAERDATAQAFASQAHHFSAADIRTLPARSHSFVREGEPEMLAKACIEWLRGFGDKPHGEMKR